MIFETHAHYDDEVFNEDRGQLLAGLPEKGIGRVINVGASIETTRTTLALAEAYDYIYAAVGVHPSDIDGLNEETYSWLKAQTAHPKTVAVGEIGLDYYWDKEPEVQAAQREWFVRQLTLAGETDLPVIIHSRDAAEDTMRILKETGRFREHPGVIHCYSYSPEQAKEYVKMGYCIGVGGVVTFKNAKKLRQTVEQISLEHILLETARIWRPSRTGEPATIPPTSLMWLPGWRRSKASLCRRWSRRPGKMPAVYSASGRCLPESAEAGIFRGVCPIALRD